MNNNLNDFESWIATKLVKVKLQTQSPDFHVRKVADVMYDELMGTMRQLKKYKEDTENS